MVDTLVDLERKFYIQQLGLTAGQASIMSAQDLDAHVDAAAFVLPSGNSYKANANIAENMPRAYAGALTGGSFTSGRIYFYAIYLTAGMSITSIAYINGTTVATGQTNFWASLWAPNLTKIAVSQDETTNIVPSVTERIFTLVGGPFVIATTGMHYVGLCYVGTTNPTGLTTLGNGAVNVLPPMLTGLASATGLTTPASCPASIVLGSVGNSILYGQVR
jgi:hypothetical protein